MFTLNTVYDFLFKARVHWSDQVGYVLLNGQNERNTMDENRLSI